MIIKNKLDSIKKINDLKLNKFPEQVFKQNESEQVKKIFRKISIKLLCNKR